VPLFCTCGEENVVTNISFSRFAYFDTNIYSHLAKNTHLWNPLLGFLLANDLCFSFSSENLAELADAKFIHQKLVDLLLCMPSVVIKTWDLILEEEVRAHPNHRAESLLLDPIVRLLLDENGHRILLAWFKSGKLAEARADQLRHARQMNATLSRLKGNFPPSKSGKYTRQQADEFATYNIMQWLADTHNSFLASFKDRPLDLHTEVFQSIRLYALVIFYKYYLGQREPKQLSDFGDLAHLCSLPYCKLVIIERDLCNILNQIKRNHDVLSSTVVRDIDFFEDWGWQDPDQLHLRS
jgi:hypothetical protein